MERVGFTSAQFVRDREPAPDIQGERVGLAIYVDGVGVCGTSETAVAAAHDKVIEGMLKSGMIPGEIEETDEQVFVGLNFDRRSGRIAVKSERVWRLRLAGDELLRRGSATGDQIRKYLGHVTWAMLMRKECLCLVSAAYRFVSWAGSRQCRLWPAVRREIKWISSILPLLFADTRRQWWGTV